jgi:PHD/YefM family antitoxin component YafN of YafNO toxin-antitoxin module
MTTIQINDKTKIGKTVLEMLKALALIENDDSIKILDETEYLLSSKANKEALMHGIKQVKEGKKGKTIKTSDLWK